jgi:hypothetical protein
MSVLVAISDDRDVAHSVPSGEDSPLQQAGYLTLIAREIDNRGALTASSGSVIDLIAASGVRLKADGDAVAAISAAATDARINHSGTITTAGGAVRLRGRAARADHAVRQHRCQPCRRQGGNVRRCSPTPSR